MGNGLIISINLFMPFSAAVLGVKYLLTLLRDSKDITRLGMRLQMRQQLTFMR